MTELDPAATATTGTATPTPLPAPPPPPPPPAATAAPDWTSGLDDGAKQLLGVKGWKTPADVIQSYTHLSKALGAEKLPLPPAGKDGARDFKEWDGWSKLGVPESPDAYTFTPPEGGEFGEADKAFQAAMRPALHAAKLAPWQADILAGALNEQSAGIEKAAQTLKTEGVAQLKTEWGGEFDAKLDLAKRAARQVFGGELGEAEQIRLADGRYLLDMPVLAKALAAIGAAMGEDTRIVDGGSGGRGGPLSAAQADAEIKRIHGEAFNNPAHAYNDRRNPEHLALHQRLAELHKIKTAG